MLNDSLALGRLKMLFKSPNVRNRMKDMGMKAVVKKKRPLLSQRHRREGLDFAIAHKDWTVDD